MRVFAHLAVICFLLLFSVTMIYPVVKHYVMDRYGASIAQAGMFVAVNLIAYAVFALVWGAVSDRMGRRKPFILVGLLGNSVMLLLQANAPNLAFLMLFRFIEGIFTVMVYSIAMAMVLDIAGREKYGRGMGVVGMGIATGMAFGSPTGGVLGEVEPVLPFYAASTIILLAFLLALFLKDTPAEASRSALRSFSLLAERKKLAIPYIFSFIDRFTAGFFVSVFPIMLGVGYEMNPRQIGMYLSSFLMPFALLQYVGGIAVDRYGRLKPLIAGSVVYAVCISLVGVLYPPAIAGALFIAGIMAAVMLPASAALSGDFALRESRGAAMGGFNFSGSLGFAFGPAVAGVVAESYGFAAAFFLAGSSVLASLLIVIALMRRWGMGLAEK
ncbi:MFS transporter [Candidatus Pyrohabitans sp.]